MDIQTIFSDWGSEKVNKVLRILSEYNHGKITENEMRKEGKRG